MLKNVSVTSALTFVAKTPVRYVESKVALQQSYNSFEELYKDVQRVSEYVNYFKKIFDIDLNFDPPFIPSSNESKLPLDFSSSRSKTFLSSNDKKKANKAKLATLIKERDKTQLKKELHKLRAQKVTGFHKKFNDVLDTKH